jgi:acetolactate synthase-1/2/3 large subunit
MKKKVSDLISDFLIQKNIDHVFGIIGSGNAHIFDSIYNNNKTEIICVHHEQAAVMAAGCYYRIRGQVSVALLTTGAGSTNGITGVVDLWMDSLPGLIISGNENSKFTKEENDLRIWGIQGYDSTGMIRKVTKYAVRVSDPKHILFELEKAYQISLQGRPGPVWIDVPMNIQSSEVEISELKKPETQKFELPPLNHSEVASVLEKLKKAKRPLLWLGHGIRLSGYHKELESFLNELQIPCLISWAGIDMLPGDHHLVVGRAGIYGQRASNLILQNCDYLLTLGTRLAMPQVGYEISELARDAKIDVVDIDAKEVEKYRSRFDQTFHADVGQFMSVLRELAQGKSQSKSAVHVQAPEEWMSYISKIRKDFPWVGPEHKDQAPFINSYPFMEKLSKILPSESITVTDMGTALLSGHQVLSLKKGQRLMTSTGLGEMGYGLPAAIGVSFANPSSQVICLNCDGGMMMNLQELQTIDHHRLPIKIVVFNNDGYLMIKHTQKALFKGRYSGTDKKSGVTCPDFKKLSVAFNLPYFQVKTWDDFDQNMNAFLNGDGPALCEVFMHPEQLLVPKLSLAIQEDGTLISPPLEDLSPLLSRDVLKKSMLVPLHPKSENLKS